MAYALSQQHFAPTQVYLNSKYADMYGGDPSYRSWCYFVFHEPIIKVPTGYKYLISLNNAEIPNSIYNVNSTTNMLTFYLTPTTDFSYFINNTPIYVYTITIAPGCYSADEICVMLSNMSFSIDTYQDGSTPTTFQLTTTYDGSINKFLFSITADTSNLNSSYYVGIDNSKTNPIFGLSGSTKIITPDLWMNLPSSGTKTTYAFYSDACVDVTGTRAAFFRLNNVHTAGFDSKAKISTNILARIPLACEPFNIIYWQNITLFKTIAQTKNLNVIEIQITDSDGNLLNFNGCDWSCSIEINVLNASSGSEAYQADQASDGLLQQQT